MDKIIGDAVMGIFGLLPSASSPEDYAVRAAMDMLDATTGNSKNLQIKLHPELDLGIGIASGKVVIGILGKPEKKYQHHWLSG